MSIYQPRKLHVVETERGWSVHDEFGLFEGPYATERDAWSVARSNEDDGLNSAAYLSGLPLVVA